MSIKDLLKSVLQTRTMKPTGECGGGCINEGEAYETDVGKIFVKRNGKNEARQMFDGEMASLEAILASKTIRVPKPLTVVDTPPSGAVLVMEYTKMDALTVHAAKLGEDMARLHLQNLDENRDDYVSKFGFHTTTCCGYLPLNNTWNNDWTEFYAKQRIQPQIDRIKSECDEKQIVDLWLRLEPLLPVFFHNITVKPSLLHGDLWSGNVAEVKDGPIVFDPASFYGHSEFDLAIAKMFGGFNRIFFDEYHRYMPKLPGYEDRLELYKLFHYLNHWNHFGASYRSPSVTTMKKLIKIAEEHDVRELWEQVLVFKEKGNRLCFKKCHECLKEFCSSCMWREAILTPRQQQQLQPTCRTCHTLTAMPLDRSELMHLRVRELQHFLLNRNIPVHTCTEKRDLVDLVLRSASRGFSQEPTTASSANSTNNPNVTQESSYPAETTASNVEAMEVDPTPELDVILGIVGEGECDKKLCMQDLLSLDVEELSIRQLKEILSRSFVTYRGCCEKGELVEKVKRLQEDAKKNHAKGVYQMQNVIVMQGIPEDNVCKICMDAPIDCVLLECGHMLSCTKCGQVLSECPICRQFIVRVVHTFRA
uniref:protein-ribulosamine 3-kinase n=1 Tax=Strigamia maritima TaxID=126957 RepID=T1IJZ4_STRMM